MQTPTSKPSHTPDTTIETNPNNNQGSFPTVQKRRQEIEELDAAIGKMNHTINAANYELMVLIREFDERAGWLKWGFKDALNWLKWRCDLSTNAARDKLRIGHALKELPLLSEHFAAGKLSYTKVRALTRVATALNEADLIDMAMRMSARHVEEHCKQRSNAAKASTTTALKALQNRNFRIWHDQAQGTVHFSIELPAEEAELIEKAVDKAAVKISADTGSAASMPEESSSWAMQQADALVYMSRSFLDGVENQGFKYQGADVSENSRSSASSSNNAARSASSAADHYQVVVHVDEAALAGAETGSSQLPIESVRRLCCDGSIVPMVENDQGEPLNVRRKVRTITTAIRRALWARDKGCGFPGCSHTRFVDAHHIQHWAEGGETSVDNLVLLCSHHHKLVHEGGYSVQRDHAGNIFYRRPDGKAVPHTGYHLDDQIDADANTMGTVLDPLVADYLKNSLEFFEVGEFCGIRDISERYSVDRSVAA